MAKINIAPVVFTKLQILTTQLIVKGYFTYPQNAKNYTDSIVAFIYTIPTLPARLTKSRIHGQYYCRYKPNRHTAWYITFNAADGVYNIENIFNNHQRSYPAFIRGHK